MATLQVQNRPKTSTNAVNRLRKDGHLPIALLSKTDGTKLIQASRAELKSLFNEMTGLPMFDVELEGDKSRVMLKDVQRDPVSRKVTHLTLQEVKPTDVVKVNIPVSVTGIPSAVAQKAATLMTPMNQLTVQAAVKDLPDMIHVDASKLGQNDRILVSDLGLSNDINVLTSPDAVIATTKQLRGMADLGADSDAAEVEAATEAEPSAEEEAPAE